MLPREVNFNVETLWNDSTKDLFFQSLFRKTAVGPVTPIIWDNWDTARRNIEETAKETVEIRIIKVHLEQNKFSWLRNEAKEKCIQENQAYLELQIP